MKIFDYTFYRIASIYKNKFNDRNGEALAALFNSLIQIFILGIILLSIAVFSNNFNNLIFTDFFNNQEFKSWKILIALIILGFNMYRYFVVCNFDKCSNNWKYEDFQSKSRNGWMIFIISSMIFVVVIILALIRQNVI
jgi:hypothetical protein